jgi:rhodanese-related sulfurtransferase
VIYKRLIGIMLVIVMLCATLVSCGSPSNNSNGGSSGNSDNSGNKANEFEVIRQAADAYLSSGKAEQFVMSVDLHTIINDGDPLNDPRILSVRDYKQYILGHICNAVCVPWRQLFVTLTPDKFDIAYFAAHDETSDNTQIVLYSYTGQEGGGVTTAALNMMGYDVISLKWGYNQWQFCPNASPGVFFEAIEGLGRVTANAAGMVTGFWAIGQNYPTETKVNEATKTYSFPVVENTTSDDPWEIIRAAAAAWGGKEEPLTAAELSEGGFEQKHKPWDTDIIPEDLFSLIHDSSSANDPFILDVRDAEHYALGHIPGAIRVPITDVCKTENLKKLPTDRKIVVVSNDGMSGSQVSGILALLGYDTANLLFGMTAWTYSDDIAPGRFHAYTADKVTFQDVLNYEICWIDTPVSEMLPPIEGWELPPMAPAEISEF